MRLGVILLVVLSFLPSISQACSCEAARQTPAVLMKGYDAVFVGEVIDVVTLSEQKETGFTLKKVRIDFDVQKSWKGVKSDKVSIEATSGAESMCLEHPFEKGIRYLVHVSGNPLRHGGMCDPVQRLDGVMVPVSLEAYGKPIWQAP